MYIYINTENGFICCHFKQKMEAKVNFLNLFTICHGVRKWKFVLCPFVDKETDESYSFAKEFAGLNSFTHLDYLDI